MNKYYPLSKTEEGIYFSCLEKTDAYNIPIIMKLGEKLDVDRFNKAINLLFSKHQCLNTILFIGDDSKVYKRIQNDEIKLNVEEVNDLNLETDYFELLNNHLYKLRLLKCKGDYYLYFDFHHIIFDGTSITLFTRDIIHI